MKTMQKASGALALAALLGASALAWAASEGAVAPMRAWPLVLCGVMMALAGLGLARIWRSNHALSRLMRLWRGAGVALASVGGFLVMMGLTQAPPAPPGQEVPWRLDWDQAQAEASARGVPLMVDFSADWCTACHELEAEVFRQPQVRDRLSREVIPVKIDLDEAGPRELALAQRFEVSGLPRVAFATAQGELMAGPSFEGKLDVAAFEARLGQALEGGAGEAGPSALDVALSEGGLAAALALVFLAGLLSSLTPCVYPLIPITISLFGARQARTRREGFALSVTYVAGIALTYAAMGVSAAMFGWVFGGLMQSPWVLTALAALFMLLGLSSLEVLPLRLPGDLQTRLSQRGGVGYVGAFSMGLVAGIIAAPCVGPIVAGVLVVVAQRQEVVLGGALLATFACGMGTLFVVLGTFSSLLGKLPRSGAWMEGVKVGFGAVFFAMALYYVRLTVSPLTEATMWLWRLVG